MTTRFNELPESSKRLLVGRVAKLYDANVSAEDIARAMNRPLELVKEAIEIIERARANKQAK